MAACGLLESVTEVDRAAAGEGFVVRVDVAERQRIDRQRPLGDRSNGRGEPACQGHPFMERQDRMAPARPSVVVGQRETAEQASRRGSLNRNRQRPRGGGGCRPENDVATCDPSVHGFTSTPPSSVSVASPAGLPSR
jgi:hypothetical protein